MKKLIVGLGNPGAEYARTRHNLGFEVIDEIIFGKKASPEINKRFEAIIYKLDDTILVKPQTFMNLSGKSVAAVSSFYKISPENILLIHDDVDFQLGEVKHQFDRSSAGNNGVESVIKSLGTQTFHRLRLGIGRPENLSVGTSNHVLDKFSEVEKEKVEKMVKAAAEVAVNWTKENRS